jgi:FkbM family methyltransferase
LILRSSTSRIARDIARAAYLAVPFKQQLFTAMRRVVVPPDVLAHKLVFQGDFPVELPNGTTFRLNHTFNPPEADIFWKGLLGGWEKQTLAMWLRLVADARVVVDVGANSGIYALSAACFRPTARVVAFEPMPRMFSKLLHNNQINDSRVACVRGALSNYDGKATMYDLPDSAHTYGGTVNRNLYDGNERTQAVAVDAIRLDSYFESVQLEHLDAVKIDVESHEPQVIEGMGHLLRDLRPSMLVEVWNDEIGAAIEAQVERARYLYYATDDISPFELQNAIRQRPHGRPLTNYLLCRAEVASKLGLTTRSP